MHTKASVPVFLLPLIALLASGDTIADSSYLKLASKHYPGSQPSRYHSGYGYPTAAGRPKDEYYRYSGASDVSAYVAKPTYSNKAQATDVASGSDQYGHSSTGQENWSPSSSWNGTYSRYPTGYIRPSYHQDLVEGSYSMYQYQHVRSPPQSAYLAYKKPSPPYFGKGKIVKAPEKPKQKKPQFMYYSSPVGYKKTMYPRVHTPYTMHKYPIKKTVHPYYRRYYQTPYAMMPSQDMLRNKVKNIYTDGYRHGEESPTTATPGVTTDRLYDTGDRSDYTSEDYANYNGSYPSRSGSYSNYYDNYEEVEQTTAGPSAEESSTRGYYGDRIYMSAQVPSQSAERGIKHRLYIVRSEPEEDEEMDTIFD